MSDRDILVMLLLLMSAANVVAVTFAGILARQANRPFKPRDTNGERDYGKECVKVAEDWARKVRG